VQSKFAYKLKPSLNTAEKITVCIH